MENFATVIEINSARKQGQLIFQVSLENRDKFECLWPIVFLQTYEQFEMAVTKPVIVTIGPLPRECIVADVRAFGGNQRIALPLKSQRHVYIFMVCVADAIAESFIEPADLSYGVCSKNSFESPSCREPFFELILSTTSISSVQVAVAIKLKGLGKE